MSTTIESGGGTLEKIMFGGVILALVLLFVALSQPAWRGEEMIAEMRSNCDKIGGVMLERKGLMSTSYECSPRFDQGIRND